MKLSMILVILAVSVGFLGLNADKVSALNAEHVYFATAIEDIKSGAETINPAGPSVDNTVTVFVNIFSLIVGIASVVMVIYGGFKFVTAAGDPNSIAGAKRTVIYSMIGVTLAALAQLIMRIVVGKVTSV